MKIIKMATRLSTEERETVLVYDNVDKVWHMDTTVSNHLNKAKKQGWTQIAEYIYEDGSVCGGAFTAPKKAITIRDPNKKRVMSDKQMKNLLGGVDEDDDEEDLLQS